MTDAVWARLEAWGQDRGAGFGAVLNPGAPGDVVAGLSATLGVEVPAEFAASLRRHDGQRFEQPFLFGGGYLLAAADIADEWRLLVELSEGADSTLRWERHWVPFVGRDGDLLLARAGAEDEQLVWTYEHETDRTTCLDVSFDGWLELWLDDLETGRLAPGDGTFDIGEDARCWPR